MTAFGASRHSHARPASSGGRARCRLGVLFGGRSGLRSSAPRCFDVPVGWSSSPSASHLATDALPAGLVAEEPTVVDGTSNGGRPAWVTRHQIRRLGTLADMAAAAPSYPAGRHQHIHKALPAVPSSDAPDPVLQQTAGTAAPATSASFEGLGVGFSGPDGPYVVRWAPPDTNGAVGPSHYVQIVNTDFAIFSKDGTVLDGPIPTNTLWSASASLPVAQRRRRSRRVRLAGRSRVITQFTNDGTDLGRIAVSTTGDPRGTYARYVPQLGLPDYPKPLSGRTPTTSRSTCSTATASRAASCARTTARRCWPPSRRLSSASTSARATADCSPISTVRRRHRQGPRIILNYGSNRLNLWKFHVD
jgi:hypothetical protein